MESYDLSQISVQESESAELGDVVHYLNVLVGCHDPEKLYPACQHLTEIIRKADDDCLHLLLEKDVVGVIITMMDALPLHSSLQQAGCDVILSCNEQVELRASLENHNAFSKVLEAMKRHSDDAQLLRKAILSLASLSATAVDEGTLKESQPCNYIISTINKHCDDVDIQRGGLWALSSLLEMDSLAALSITLQEGHNIIFDSVKSHSANPDIIIHGFQCLRCIIKCDINSEKVQGIINDLEYVIEVLVQYSIHEDVTTAALGLIEALYLNKMRNQDEQTSPSNLTSHRLVQLISQLLNSFTELAEVQFYGFNIFRYILTVSRIEVTDKLLENWLNLLHIAMSYHGENIEVNESCCHLLSRLLVLYPHIHSRIGDVSESKIPLQKYLWMILLHLSYNPNPSLFTAASTALCHLFECSELLQQYLLKKGVTVALIECLREYIKEFSHNDKCVECGCRALRGTLMHHCSDEQKQYLLDVGIFEDLQAILDGFICNADVIVEAFCVIACLSDLSTFQEAVIAHSLYKAILEIVKRHIANEILIEVALEIFIILSLNAEVVRHLNDFDILKTTVSMVKTHVTYPSLQFKGCMLIRLLCDSNYLVSESLCTTVASVVVDALSRKKDNKVQSEALACAQVLCKCSNQMAKALVKGDIHILLFNLLYEDVGYELCSKSDGEDLLKDSEDNIDDFFLQVGTDIIYTLSCYWDFKQEMLTTAVKDGLIEGVSVLLEIGADLNVEENPLSLAVNSRNESMVELLLTHGITNINVQRAIKISREKNLDKITGLLLEHLAVDRNRDSVDFSGLDLDTLKPLWILPSLGVKTLPTLPTQSYLASLPQRKQSLDHVKDVLVRRKSVVSMDSPLKMPCSETGVQNTRRMSVDLSSLKYVSDRDRNKEATNFGHHPDSQKILTGENHFKQTSHPSSSLVTRMDIKKEDEFNDSGVDTIDFSPMVLPKCGPSYVTELSSDQANSHKNIVSGATAMPSGQLDQYTQDNFVCKKLANVTTCDSSSFSSADYSLSPSQLFRQLQRHHRKHRHILSDSDSCFSLQEDSPIPLFYDREDLEMSGKCFLSDEKMDQNGDTGDKHSILGEEKDVSIKHSVSENSFSNSNSSYQEAGSEVHISGNDSHIIGLEEVDFISNEISLKEPLIKEPSRRLIKMLDLSSNQLSDFKSLLYLPFGGEHLFKQLKDVSIFDVKQNHLSELLGDMMKEMMKLRIINLSCNNFCKFPTEAVLSAKLSEIDLSSNQLTEVPSLPPMTNLIRFNLSYNQLSVMPECVHGEYRVPSFPHLRYFDLRNNQIVAIPNLHARLDDLEILNISKNRIQALPDEFLASMPSLKVLDASMNEISYIGEAVGEDMVFLEEIRLSSNFLSTVEVFFNNFITSVPALQIIDASKNELTTIPSPSAWKSLGIREIRYNGNKITKIDLSDCKKYWSRLESLYVGHNKLKEIPKEIGQLHSLCCLDISHNKDIKQLPGEMGDLDRLFILNLQGLKNLSLSPSLLNGPTKEIISYLKSRHTRSIPYYCMKMMVVGAADKGKTTLLRRLIKESNVSNSRANVATVGVNVKHWNYQHKRSGRNVVTYHISCWDFAGQEEFYSTHQCFLSQRSLYVLVYNLYCGEDELKYLQPWLLNIQARAPSSCVMIVGTHLDNFDLPQDIIDKKRIEMRSKIKNMLSNPGFPCDVSYAEVSCLNDRHITDLRAKIKDLIDNARLRGQKIMGGLVPSNYIALEELIQKEKKRLERSKSRFPVILESRLQELMEENKLNSKMDKSELEQAIKFLHECGVLLHFNDLQTKLCKLYFLDPEWLCTLMAHIITFKHISFVNEKGFMPIKSVPHLLKEPRFPSEFIPEYVRLLERFEVVLRHTEEELLIPSCLPKMRPSGVHVPHAASQTNLVRRYALCYIPPGFFPRLIARLIALPKRTTNQEKNSEPEILHLWFGGIYLYWSEVFYCLLEMHPSQANCFDIIVPITSLGVKLLCNVVDNVEALIDEWYPGLRDLNIVGGSELVKPMSVCPFCSDSTQAHCFPLKNLIHLSYISDEVECPIHKGKVKLELLAPDVIIGDLDQKYKISPDKLSLNEIAQNNLGKGGFGSVYKASYNGQTVAVKIFSQSVASMNNTTPSQLIRQEIQILSKIIHPHVISLIGVCLKPKAMLVLEYAELGSLSSMKPYSSFNTVLKHRITIQISSALAFLHKSSIIYRDLKAGNVLLFSLSTVAKINVKLSDYGISCYATAAGLTQLVGTPGHRAPELLMSPSSSMPYYDKVDIYAYGLLLFELMTNGHKPFEELGAGFEIDKFILEGRPIDDISQYGCTPWPDMQDLINNCLQYIPVQRPSAQEIFDRLCTSEFMALKRAISIERDQTVETFAIRCFSDKYSTKNTELWVVSTLGVQSMLSILNLSQRNTSPQGTMMPPDILIHSMVSVDSSFVLMGSNHGDILVYDGFDKQLKHYLKSLNDSILCLIHVKALKGVAYYVCAGLASGFVVFYDKTLIMTPNANGQMLNVGKGPVKSIKRYHSKLYVICGIDIVVITISNLAVEKRWSAFESLDTAVYLTNIEVGLNCVWTTHSESSQVHLWDQNDGTPVGILSCDTIVNSILPQDQIISQYEARITSILLQPAPYSILWIGLSSGHLLLLNALSRKPLMVTKRHVNSVRCLQLIKSVVAEKPVNCVISGGFGFLRRPGYCSPNKGTPETYGSLLVWDSIMPRLKSTYDVIKAEMDVYK